MFKKRKKFLTRFIGMKYLQFRFGFSFVTTVSVSMKRCVCAAPYEHHEQA